MEPVTWKSKSLKAAFAAAISIFRNDLDDDDDDNKPAAPATIQQLPPAIQPALPASALNLYWRILGMVVVFLAAMFLQSWFSFLEKPTKFVNTIATFFVFCVIGEAFIQNGIEGTALKIVEYFQRILAQGQM